MGMPEMAATRDVISAAELDPALLAELKTATPEQIGDGLAPDVAELLLGAADFATAAGATDPEQLPSSGTGFQAFPAGSPQGPDADGTERVAGFGENTRDKEGEEPEGLLREGRPNFPQGLASGGGSSTFGSLNLSVIGAASLSAGGLDIVEFSDTVQWKFSHTDGDFMVYHEDDGSASRPILCSQRRYPTRYSPTWIFSTSQMGTIISLL